jgi:hypothetical protein
LSRLIARHVWFGKEPAWTTGTDECNVALLSATRSHVGRIVPVGLMRSLGAPLD